MKITFWWITYSYFWKIDKVSACPGLLCSGSLNRICILSVIFFGNSVSKIHKIILHFVIQFNFSLNLISRISVLSLILWYIPFFTKRLSFIFARECESEEKLEYEREKERKQSVQTANGIGISFSPDFQDSRVRTQSKTKSEGIFEEQKIEK